MAMECSVLETVAKVHIVDDDPAMRQLLSVLVKSMQLCPEPYASAREFLEYCEPSEPGCVLLDVRMPEMSGLELLEVMRQQGIPFPVIVLSAYSDVPTAVRAMRAGAINYIEKPFREQQLWEAIQEALQYDVKNRRVLSRKGRIRRRLAKLTSGERNVLDCLLEGRANKGIAAELEVSVRTVEVRRAKIMEKMEAESLAELIRFTLEASLSAGTLPPGG